MANLVALLHLIAATQFIFAVYYVTQVFSLPQTKEHAMFHSYGGHYRFLTNWNVFFYALWYNTTYVNYPITLSHEPPCCGKWKFLTIWNCLIQAIFYVVCLANDFVGSNEVSPRKIPLIRKIKDFFHATVGFPLSAFVTLTFWGLYAIDRELVFPRTLDPFFPTWLNHLLHTNILIFTLVELYTSFSFYPSRKKGLTSFTGFMLIYLVWTFVIYAKTGGWVYPIMAVLNWPQRIAFFLVLLVVGQALYIAGELLNKLFWGKAMGAIGSTKKASRAKAH